MKIKEIMKKEVFCVPFDCSVIDAARMMQSSNVGCLVVTQNGQAKGILTDRDIVLKVTASGSDPSSMKVSDIMQTRLIFASPEMDLLDASRLMASHQVRRLPVVENGHVIGIVSTTDLSSIVKEEIDNLLSIRATPVYH